MGAASRRDDTAPTSNAPFGPHATLEETAAKARALTDQEARAQAARMTIDPAKDDILTAIAKLGGISRTMARARKARAKRPSARPRRRPLPPLPCVPPGTPCRPRSAKSVARVSEA